MRNYFLLMVMMLFFGHGFLYAQDGTEGYIGLVVDQYGNPVPNVEISEKDGNFKVFTDDNGNFSFDYKHGIVLSLFHPGYQKNEVKLKKGINKNKVYKVVLNQKFLKNPDVIPTIDGYSNKESSVGAVAIVYTDQITKKMSSNLVPGLTGRLSGLNITQYQGTQAHPINPSSVWDLGGYFDPFHAIVGNNNDNSMYSVRLRGQNPVTVVDGVLRDFTNLDPESVESISIHKDALSSIKLGMLSSRGAMVVTTKMPINQGFQFSFTGRYGVNSSIKTPKPLSSYQYAYLLNEALQNDGKEGPYSLDDFNTYLNGTNPLTHPDVNWYKTAMKDKAAAQSYNLNVSGGGKVAQFFINVGYYSEDGLFREDKNNSYDTNLKYERYLINSKINVNITDALKAEATVIGRIEEGNQPGDAGNGYSGLLGLIYTTPNNAYPIFNPPSESGGIRYGGNASFTRNIYAQTLDGGYISDNARDVMASVKLSYDFDKVVKGLSAKVHGSISSQSRSAIVRWKRNLVYEYKLDEAGNPLYNNYGSYRTQENDFTGVYTYEYLYGQFAVNYDRIFNEKHDLGIELSVDQRREIHNFFLPEMPINIIASAKYNYAKKYFLEGAFVNSHYNRYAPGKRWGSFYAFGAGWDISKENFLADADWLDLLKLRAVYGLTGEGLSKTGYYNWRQSYAILHNGVYSQGEQRNSGKGIEEKNPIANPNVTWEKAHKFNLGLDLELFNKTLLFTAEYYRDKYFDLLQQRGKQIQLIGIAYPDENIGKRRYEGVELSLTYQNNVGNFNYYITGNWSREKSKILFIDEQYVPHDYLKITGRPYGSIFGLVAEGFFQSEEEVANSAIIQGFAVKPGDIKYKDMNEDGKIDEFDRTVVGGDKPLSYFGLNFGFEYRGLELSVLFQGAYNRDIYMDSGDAMRPFNEGFLTVEQGYGQAYEHMMNRWTPETASTATFPRLTAGGNNYNRGNNWGSSFWVHSGNYIRLKNLYVAYTLPEAFSRNYLGGLKVKLFASGDNLLTQSAYSLVDPEIINFSSYPTQKNVNIGLNVKF